MSTGRRVAAVRALGLIAALIPGRASAADLDANLERLRSMPLAQRQELARDLERLDGLPREQQAALRELDRQVREADPEAQARYLAVLRRYYLWVQGLPDEQQERLRAARPEDRIALVRQLFTTHPLAPASRFDPVLAGATTLNLHPVFDQMHWIRTWLALKPAQRTEVERARPADRIAKLEAVGRQAGLPDDRPGLLRRYEQEALRRFQQGARRPGYAALKPQMEVELVRRGAEARLLQNYHPDPVEPENLLRFIAALPSWLREQFDPLPPAAARRRLTILYRLLDPSPKEMPGSQAPAKPVAPPGNSAPTTNPAAPATAPVPPVANPF